MNKNHSNDDFVDPPNYDVAMFGIGVLVGMIIALSAVYILMKMGFILI